jgi:hypothetical protein
LDVGLVEAKSVPARHGRYFEFTTAQLERAHLVKALLQKGVPLAKLAASDLGFADQAFVVFDGDRLRGCQDAAAAIATVVKAKWCSAVDLGTIRGALRN